MPSSPTGVDAPLEYLTVDAYAWPQPERTKRSRQEPEVRKLKHRENQRRFMVRKQARIATLRREVEFMELELKYLQALEEEKVLRNEILPFNVFPTEEQPKDCDTTTKGGPFEPLDPRQVCEPMELDSMLTEVLLSL